jgi:murein DD-endopeptidase MepM/ murein hydrolase activator NlpD
MPHQFVDSYDPRVWAANWTPPAAGRLISARVPGGRRALAPALAVAVLLAGAGAAWLSRPRTGAPAGSRTQAARVVSPAAPAPAEIRRTLVLPQSADLRAALSRFGLPSDLAARITAAAAPGLRPTGEIRAALVLRETATGPVFDRLEASNGDSSGVVVRRLASGELSASTVAAQIQSRIMVKHGTMDGDSFYSSAVAVGIPNSLIPLFAKALAFDFDFQREVTAGDAFEAAYSQPVNSSGGAVGAPTLLYASMTTGTKSAAVYRFAPGGGEGAWYDSSGRSVIRSLMRTPVDGARITSKFGLRFHPILHFMKLHGGVDFAAPTGTPIYAAGNGVVEWAAMKGGNGNLTILKHDNGWETYYLHQSLFMPGVVPGARVTQGQHIGNVGTTGRSTGPHLHYEVHIDGEKVDPLSIQTDSSGQTLSGAELIAFERIRDEIDVSRAQ